MISSLTPVTTAVPLIGVLALSAVKDAYDDIVSFFFTFHEKSALAPIVLYIARYFRIRKFFCNISQ